MVSCADVISRLYWMSIRCPETFEEELRLVAEVTEGGAEAILRIIHCPPPDSPTIDIHTSWKKYAGGQFSKIVNQKALKELIPDLIERREKIETGRLDI